MMLSSFTYFNTTSTSCKMLSTHPVSCCCSCFILFDWQGLNRQKNSMHQDLRWLIYHQWLFTNIAIISLLIETLLRVVYNKCTTSPPTQHKLLLWESFPSKGCIEVNRKSQHQNLCITVDSTLLLHERHACFIFPVNQSIICSSNNYSCCCV